MGKILDRVLSIFRRTKPEKIIPKPSGITRPDAIERIPARITRQTGIFTEGTGAPLEPEHRERFEKVFGPAVTRNGYKHPVILQNDLLSLSLMPGESRVIPEVLQASYDRSRRHNMIQEWDPLKTLRDLIAEYERSMDPIAHYQSSTETLCAASKITAWRLRGQQIRADAPHRPITDRWQDPPSGDSNA